MGRQKDKENGRFVMGIVDELVEKIKTSEVINKVRDTPPSLLAGLMLGGAAMVFLTLYLLYLIFFKLPIIGITLIMLGGLFIGFYLVARKLSTHKEEDDNKYY